MEEQERLLGEYRAEWTRALLEGTETDLRAGLLRELALYAHAEPEEMERRCTAALATLRDERRRDVDPERRSSIERFYESPTTIYELVDWHSLRDDNGPLEYILAFDHLPPRSPFTACAPRSMGSSNMHSITFGVGG